MLRSDAVEHPGDRVLGSLSGAAAVEGRGRTGDVGDRDVDRRSQGGLVARRNVAAAVAE